MKKKILVGAIISTSVLMSTQVVAQEYIYRISAPATSYSNDLKDEQAEENTQLSLTYDITIDGTGNLRIFGTAENTDEVSLDLSGSMFTENVVDNEYMFSLNGPPGATVEQFLSSILYGTLSVTGYDGDTLSYDITDYLDSGNSNTDVDVGEAQNIVVDNAYIEESTGTLNLEIISGVSEPYTYEVIQRGFEEHIITEMPPNPAQYNSDITITDGQNTFNLNSYSLYPTSELPVTVEIRYNDQLIESFELTSFL